MQKPVRNGGFFAIDCPGKCGDKMCLKPAILDMDLVCSFCIEDAEHLPDRPHPYFPRLPMFALKKCRLAPFLGNKIDPTDLTYDYVSAHTIADLAAEKRIIMFYRPSEQR